LFNLGEDIQALIYLHFCTGLLWQLNFSESLLHDLRKLLLDFELAIFRKFLAYARVVKLYLELFLMRLLIISHYSQIRRIFLPGRRLFSYRLHRYDFGHALLFISGSRSVR